MQAGATWCNLVQLGARGKKEKETDWVKQRGGWDLEGVGEGDCDG